MIDPWQKTNCKELKQQQQQQQKPKNLQKRYHVNLGRDSLAPRPP